VEQYDALLKLLTGHSLKDEPLLWEAFKNLKDARNAFVHEGIAKIGQTPVSTESANKLIASASDIIAKIREWLPNELHWPEFKYDLTVEIQKRLFRKYDQKPRLCSTALVRKFGGLAGVLSHDGGGLGRRWRRGLIFCEERCSARLVRLLLPTV
jgi:hypothetical protein